MSNQPLQRIAAASGVAYVALIILGNEVLFGAGAAPDSSSSREEISAYLAGHGATTGREWAGVYVELLGLLAFIVFVGSLWTVLRRAEGEDGPFAGIAFGAGLVSAGVKLASLPAALAVYYRVEQGFDPALSAALLDMNGMSFVLTWAIDAVLLGATAVVVLRTRALPRWLGFTAAALAPALLAGVALPLSLGFLPFMLTLLWIAATSIVLVLRAGRPRAAAEAPTSSPPRAAALTVGDER